MVVQNRVLASQVPDGQHLDVVERHDFVARIGALLGASVVRRRDRCERYISSQIVTNRDVFMYRFDSVCFGRAG